MRVGRSAPLPIRDGVTAGRLVVPAGQWPRLLDYLAERFRFVTPDEIAARMFRGDIVGEDGSPLNPDQACLPNLVIYYYRSLPPEDRIPFEETILFMDDRIVVVDKPHFLPVTPTGRFLQETLLIRLIRKLGIETLTPIHRLDRETAGVMLFSIQPRFRDQYQGLFRSRSVAKSYEAIAPFRADFSFPILHSSRLVAGEPFMRMRETQPDEPGIPNSRTTIDLIEIWKTLGLARYRLTPETGKKHQLRVHMASLGMPIVNDTLYPEALRPDEITARGYRYPLQLLARGIGFHDPISGEYRQFESQLQLSGGEP